MIYLDNAATTQIDSRVLDAMMPYLTSQYGNAGTLYGFGRSANEAVQKARSQVAEFINARPEQIIFTSGGSEANSLVFQGSKDYLKSVGKTHILVSSVEHDSVLKAAESLIKEGFYIEYLPVCSDGTVSVQAVDEAITSKTGLVSVMYVNNETGATNPVDEIGAICQKYGVLFHTDCVQAAGCHSIDVEEICCDFLSLSSHKIHGCKGVGSLFAKDASRLCPIIYGGSEQEFGLRGGTENVAGIVGFGEACKISGEYFYADTIMLLSLKLQFYTTLVEELKKSNYKGSIRVNGAPASSQGKTLNLRFNNVDAETLLLMLDSRGVCVSAGSACCSREVYPSHVLTAMGLSEDEARSSVRISFSRMNTVEDAAEAAITLADCIQVLQSHNSGSLENSHDVLMRRARACIG